MIATRSRSAAKAVTWRITGTADTFIISLLITKKPVVAASPQNPKTPTNKT